jgi:hypothetical protein
MPRALFAAHNGPLHAFYTPYHSPNEVPNRPHWNLVAK